VSWLLSPAEATFFVFASDSFIFILHCGFVFRFCLRVFLFCMAGSLARRIQCGDLAGPCGKTCVSYVVLGSRRIGLLFNVLQKRFSTHFRGFTETFFMNQSYFLLLLWGLVRKNKQAHFSVTFSRPLRRSGRRLFIVTDRGSAPRLGVRAPQERSPAGFPGLTASPLAS
jgi:hypothetical protein